METLGDLWSSNYESILISLGIGFVFFVLGPMGLWFSGRKIRKERINKAKETMLDLVEGMIVSQEDINNPKLRKLFGAIEREVDVSIDSAYDLERLFEDIALRFQRSKHLDASQKSEYTRKLDELASALNAAEVSGEQRVIPRKYSEIINSLENAAKENNLEFITTNIEELKKKLIRIDVGDDPIFRVFYLYKNLIKNRPWLLAAVIGIYGIIIATFSYFGELP